MSRSGSTTLPALLAVMTLVLAACGSTAESTPADDDGGAVATPSPTAEADGGETGDTVSLAGNQFSPSSLTIAAGTTVTFTGTASHTVTEGSNGEAVDDPIVDETGGADIEVTFDEPGRYNITCKIHPQMNMTITVEG
jgi:plastocyanin